MKPFWTVSLFWIATVACVAVALAFILPPLLRRKEVSMKAARRDINVADYRDQMQEMDADRARGQLLDPDRVAQLAQRDGAEKRGAEGSYGERELRRLLRPDRRDIAQLRLRQVFSQGQRNYR